MADNKGRHHAAGQIRHTIDPDVDGPFDIDDFDDPEQAEVARLNLGSVLIPVPETGQLQVELTETGVPSAVWVITPNGRFTIAAYAAPKTTGLWRDVAAGTGEWLRVGARSVRRRWKWPRSIHRGRRVPLDDPLRGQRSGRHGRCRGRRSAKRVGRHRGTPRRHPDAGAPTAAGGGARGDGRAAARGRRSTRGRCRKA